METNNMNIRERFEEIWPVPEGIEWLSNAGRYVQITGKWLPMGASQAYNARLDTFTRCQETTAQVNEIIFHATNLLNYVRDKYGVIGDDFSCEHMRGIAAAIKEIQK